MIPTEVLGGGILLLLVYVLSASHVARYYAKFTLFFVLITIAATVFIPLMLLTPRDYRNALLPSWGARQISKLLGLQWKVRGLENVVKDSGCVVIINHQSALDLLVLAEIWPLMERCTVISKRELFYLWPFGLACWLWGTIFIDRLNVEKAITTVNNTGQTIRTKKVSSIFPIILNCHYGVCLPIGL
ncbi:1-acyl-sn-glycerol-3-phosphate acyltransferase alpha isoform X2 [Nilaparvata lugens]|nr:1-acyl-sn-glycerol-3-phosphate acyltransferase alpha isoform X2 [Nilaparvata lugens]XP_039288699.1 1-acyl-sn-glycerol-3-phosphate acyltransferase alpha isoform X2 [Nilaparvata lugens]XP_039288701.1 1-acyl-sn-glycerol-3-phosphate acyltransferase alpha isoform X2 [Nilaparvata lugens]XP_039288702.1 1-acyl-sn-glycerol-3-phosphate acyltransferase alpha isoform X2 [Nilaparvata lugens]XP_039288703.1 1-acyl-sn-glycerol-3-phosphate acyltransferase alpha isoform X2 [Nilaparvata lugens]XP_039288704.1 